MANILDYVKKYKNMTHEQKAFNELDYLILSTISYINFADISNFHNKITLEEVGKRYFKKYTNADCKKNISGIQSAIKIFKSIYGTPRYKDLLLYNYAFTKNNAEQFSAISIDINKYTTFISFEGTDDLIVGWKEDAELAYKFPTLAQKDAIKYLNYNIKLLTKKEIIVGGHSKGGNLSLVAGMYANTFVRSKIKHIYSFDGPGLKLEQMNSRFYRRIKDKYTLVVPNYSVIGVLLYHPEDMLVISSDHIGIIAHNCLFWQIRDDQFIKAELSEFSKKVDETFINWLNNYNEDERKKFVEDLFMVFKRANIDSLLDIKYQVVPKIWSILRESKNLSKETKKMIKSLVDFMYKNLKGVAIDTIKDKISSRNINFT